MSVLQIGLMPTLTYMMDLLPCHWFLTILHHQKVVDQLRILLIYHLRKNYRLLPSKFRQPLQQSFHPARIMRPLMRMAYEWRPIEVLKVCPHPYKHML